MVESVELPRGTEFLWRPSRYKVLYGGRGSGKSWTIAQVLLLMGMQRPIRVMCARETMESIRQSVHHLLASQIQRLGIGHFYDVGQAIIRGRNGAEFFFAGLKHNVDNIKSAEAIDIVWISEAASVSHRSLDVLIPTVRKEGSEIWIDFNPHLESDAVWQRFVQREHPQAKVARLNYVDNPWCPQALKDEAEYIKQIDPANYAHIYLGQCVTSPEGAVYRDEMIAAENEGRITRVPVDISKPVQTAWDLGWNDTTAIWFAQAIGYEYRIVDYLEIRKTTISDIVRQLQAKGYTYGTDYLPHDGASEQLAAGGRSIQQQMISFGRRVHIVPRSAPMDGINAVRTIFPSCVFDRERCADGLQSMRMYRWADPGKNGQVKREPLHDEHSHAADAFRYLALSLRPQMATKPPQPLHKRSTGGVWV